MSDPHEIIITTRENPNQPRVVQFSDLFSIRDDIKSMMYLWNANCYYVDVVDQVFIINGGRKIKIEAYDNCKVMYRRRNAISYTVNSNNGPKKKVNWLLGLEEIKTEKMVFLQISEDGCFWSWENKL